MPSSHLLQFIGGLAFFFFGLFSTHLGLQSFAGDRLKSMVARATQSRLKALVSGILVTLFYQSSSAVTVMTVGLVSSGLLSLELSMAVSLGAGIGTTFVVLLISIKEILDYGILLIAGGLCLRWLATRVLFRLSGEVLFGLGFVFFGLNVMSQATAPLQTYPWIPQIFQFMEQYPLADFLIAAVVTALVHSSGVILGILLALAFAGAITFSAALPMVLGANIGTSFTAIMAGIRATTEGKRSAWANLLLRAGAVLLIYPLMDPFAQLVHRLDSFLFIRVFETPVSVHGDIAMSHFFFNLFVALVFFPLLPIGKKIVCWLIPSRKKEGEAFGPKYLDKMALSVPTLAFAQATREMLRMGEIVLGMLRDFLPLFQKYDYDMVDDLRSRDHQVDTLYRSIKFYLSNLSLQNLKEEDAGTSIHLITVVNEWENIGDTIDRHILRLAHKKWNKGIEFSGEGWKEIVELHRGTVEMTELALAALSAGNREIAAKMLTHQLHYADREDELKMSHLVRLHERRKESIDTSAIHLELLSLFHRINLSLITMVSNLLPERERKE
ncbi:MAG: Na/Pi cotransporter family protein [Deltaproteobacteria bacterium]|nr:Na/Pi cotransporter family protein [Deltaproteobacteria bacterium]